MPVARAVLVCLVSLMVLFPVGVAHPRAQPGIVTVGGARLVETPANPVASVGPRRAVGSEASGPGREPRSSAQAPATPPARPVTTTTTEPQQQPTFRGLTSFVRVDVAVTDKKGQPITDLTAADLEITEDGKPQTIEQFKLIRVDGNPLPDQPRPRDIRDPDVEAQEASRDDVRVFAIFLDDYHVRLSASMRMREPLIKFVRTQLRPNDMVAIMYPLTPVTTLTFTRDENAIISALSRFEGRKYDYRPRNAAEASYQRMPTTEVEKIRNDVVITALSGLTKRLGSIRETRKSILFVSEGLTSYLPPNMRRRDASVPMGQSEIVAGNPEQEETMAVFNKADVYMRLRDVFEDATRNNTAIYSLDTRGLASGEFDAGDGPLGVSFASDRIALSASQDTLRALADETGGRAIINTNAMAGGLAQMVQDASFYYLVGYNSTQAPMDGKFHEIKVNVKRRGVDVRARKGYWAGTAADAAKAANPTPEVAKPYQQALASIATSVHSAKYVRTWIGTQRGENGKTRVTLVWEPLPADTNLRRETAGRVSLLAATEKGDVVFRGNTSQAAPAPTSAATTGASRPASAPQRLVFDAPPGKLEMRLTVEAVGGGTLDQEVRNLVVPDLTAPEAMITTPRVFRSRTARDLQAIAADPNAIPVPGRELSRAERVFIRFDVYGGGVDRPEPRAVLLNRAGQKMADVAVAPATAGGTHQIDLGLNSLAPGEYLIEITVKGVSGEATEVVPLRVTS